MSILEPVPQEQDDQDFSLGEEGTSLFDDIRPTNQKMRAKKTEDFDIPGYENPDLNGRSQLVARYHRMDLEQFTIYQKSITEAVAADKFDQVFTLYADLLIDNCDGILKRLPSGDLVDLGVKYDLPLADGLRFDAHSCQDVVRGVFGNNELAVADHGQKVFEWMLTGKTADDSEALGKS